MHSNTWQRRLSLWVPPLVYMVLIFHFSSESNPLPELTAHVPDKLLHTIEYSGLALLFGRALAGEGLTWLAAIVGATVLTSAYGAADEYHQLFVPLRNSDVRDWLADTLGATVGAVAYHPRLARLIRLHIRRVDLDGNGLADQID